MLECEKKAFLDFRTKPKSHRQITTLSGWISDSQRAIYVEKSTKYTVLSRKSQSGSFRGQKLLDFEGFSRLLADERHDDHERMTLSTTENNKDDYEGKKARSECFVYRTLFQT